MFPFIYNHTGITDDKVLHFLFSFVIAWGLYLILKRKHGLKKTFLISAIIILIIGIIKETVDSFIPGRNVEIMDIVANFVGMGTFYVYIIVANIIKSIIKGKRNIKE